MIGGSKMKTFTGLVFLISIFSTFAQAGDSPAVHGLLVFGQKSIYLSHLPMFHHPHDYQVLLEADLGLDANAAFFGDQKLHPDQKVYTFAPYPMVLPDVVVGKISFSGDLYRGHFEKDGVMIKSSITASIRKVLYFQKFDPNATRARQLTYLLFGRAGDLWMAHLISTKPDFDQIAHVLSPQLVPGPGQVVHLKILNATTTSPLQDGQDYSAWDGGKNISVESVDTQYIEFDDLS